MQFSRCNSITFITPEFVFLLQNPTQLMAKKKKEEQPGTSQKSLPKFTLSKKQQILLGGMLMLFSIALVISFVSFFSAWQADQSILSELADRHAPAQNWMSKFGASISHFFLYKGFGASSFIFAFLLFLTGLYFFFNFPKKTLINHWLWGSLAALWLSVLFGFFSEQAPLLGGVVGFELNQFLKDYISNIGIVLLLLFGLIFFLVVKVNFSPEKALQVLSKTKKEITDELAEPLADAPAQTPITEEKGDEDFMEPVLITPLYTPETPVENLSDVEIENLFQLKQTEETPPAKLEVEVAPLEEEAVETLAKKLVEEGGEFDPRLELGHYRFPTLDLLNDYGSASITIDQEELEENKNRIVETLRHYKIDIAHIKATIGPTVTLYEIVPAAGIRISKIKSLEDDIALSLAALGIRIIAPIPGKGTIGIEVPNKNPSIVSMRSVIASPKFQNAEMELPIALGKTISNETFVVDLAKMPHLLMAGATGQGKSVGLNAVLTSLVYKKHPAEVKFVLVDPKKVELTLFSKIERHFLAKLPNSEDAIITDNSKVIYTLNSLCIEMENRYELLKDARVRNIKEYNSAFKARKLNPNEGHKFLPYIVLVVDEFADLIMSAGKEVETPIARLAQLARAIGIHLIIATQRPSVNVITGLIKANFPARIAFRVTSKIDSRTILDSQGAEQLIGRGDMLYTQGNDLVRVQCAFIDTPEVSKITEYIGSQRAYPDAFLLPEYEDDESGTAIDIDISERDSLFNEAAEIVVMAQQGSTSLLQRKLKLGYNRAGRLIDQLEAAGVVGPFEGSKARQVLISDITTLQQLLNNDDKNNG